MIEICEEMQKFRNLLDANNINWHDASDDYGDLYICRTHLNDYKFSCVNGFGTYGGLHPFTEENDGLLEVMVKNQEPIGFLTAKQAYKLVEKIKG